MCIFRYTSGFWLGGASLCWGCFHTRYDCVPLLSLAYVHSPIEEVSICTELICKPSIQKKKKNWDTVKARPGTVASTPPPYRARVHRICVGHQLFKQTFARTVNHARAWHSCAHTHQMNWTLGSTQPISGPRPLVWKHLLRLNHRLECAWHHLTYVDEIIFKNGGFLYPCYCKKCVYKTPSSMWTKAQVWPHNPRPKIEELQEETGAVRWHAAIQQKAAGGVTTATTMLTGRTHFSQKNGKPQALSPNPISSWLRQRRLIMSEGVFGFCIQWERFLTKCVCVCVLNSPAHNFVCEQNSAHFWILVLSFVRYGLRGGNEE